jgi:NDP-sugar pyrophosphorylase family protein
MKALVMAGGKGTRLHPYSAVMPKPLMPIGNTPVLELLLKRLARAGVDHAILGVNHLRHLIEAFFGDGSRLGIKITYSTEDRPLGTAGQIGMVLDELGDDFIITNGDLLTTLNIERMVGEHALTGADATIGSYLRELKSDFGILEMDEDMRLCEYREKPTFRHLVSMGVYVLKASAVRPHVSRDEPLDMPELLRLMLASGCDVRCFRDECFWLDIGRPEDFGAAQQLYEENPGFFG